MNKFFTATLFSLASVVFSFGQTNWDLLNPTPSYETGLDVHFLSTEHGYMITRSQLIETTDAGASWQVKQTFGSSDAVADMAFLNSMGFIVGKNGYIAKTVDGGSSWSEVNINVDDHLHTVQIIDSETIIVSSANKIIKSTNGGGNWESLEIPNETANTTFFVNSATGHAGCTNGTILKTIDGGASWYITEQVSFVPSDFVNLHFVNENIGFASREHNELFKTEDGGETWAILDGINDLVYSMHFIDENIGYVAGEYGVIFQTTDGGDNWEWVSFQNGRISFTGVYGLYFFDADSGYAVGERGRITKTTDGGGTWTDYAPTYIDINQIDFPTAETGYARARHELFKTTDSGITWESIGQPLPDEKINAFDFANENTGYVIAGGDVGSSAASRFVFKTTDGGSTWTATNNGNAISPGSGLIGIDFIDENTGFAIENGTFEAGVFHTADGGGTWSRVSDKRLRKIQFVSDTVGYAIDYIQDFLFRTTDGGSTWEDFFAVDERVNDFHFVDPDNGYLVGEDRLIFKTENAGTDWQELDIPYDDYELVEFVTPEIGYIIDDDGLIYKTEDGGLSWDYIIQLFTINDICFTDEMVYLGGTYGKILSAYFGIVSNKEIFRKNHFDITVFPNPSLSHFYVKNDGKNKITSISVYDINGKKIQGTEQVNETDNIQVSLPHNTKGIYMVEITLDHQYKVIEKLTIH